MHTKVRAHGGVGKERLPHPRGEFDGPLSRMCADALEHIDQVGIGIHRVQPARHQQTLDDADPLRAELARSESSRPGELPPGPLSEPYVNVSAHTAPERALGTLVECLSASRRVFLAWSCPTNASAPCTPSLHAHYKRFITTTSASVPGPRHRYSRLAGSPLSPSPLPSAAKFPRSLPWPCPGSCLLNAGCRVPSKQVPGTLVCVRL